MTHHRDDVLLDRLTVRARGCQGFTVRFRPNDPARYRVDIHRANVPGHRAYGETLGDAIVQALRLLDGEVVDRDREIAAIVSAAQTRRCLP